MVNKYFLIELNKLMVGLAERGIPFVFTQIFDGGKVDVPSQNWDAVCHIGSYGHHDALLEVMGDSIIEDSDDTVEGYLTANEILKRVDKLKRV